MVTLVLYYSIFGVLCLKYFPYHSWIKVNKAIWRRWLIRLSDCYTHMHTRIRNQIPRAHKKAGCVRTPLVIPVYRKANSWTGWIWELWLQWESLLQGMNSRIKRLLVPHTHIFTQTHTCDHMGTDVHAWPHTYTRNKLLLYYDRILYLLNSPEKWLWLFETTLV